VVDVFIRILPSQQQQQQPLKLKFFLQQNFRQIFYKMSTYWTEDQARDNPINEKKKIFKKKEIQNYFKVHLYRQAYFNLSL